MASSSFALRTLNKRMSLLRLEVPNDKLGRILVAIGMAWDGADMAVLGSVATPTNVSRRSRKSTQRDKKRNMSNADSVLVGSLPVPIPPLAKRSEGGTVPTAQIVKTKLQRGIRKCSDKTSTDAALVCQTKSVATKPVAVGDSAPTPSKFITSKKSNGALDAACDAGTKDVAGAVPKAVGKAGKMDTSTAKRVYGTYAPAVNRSPGCPQGLATLSVDHPSPAELSRDSDSTEHQMSVDDVRKAILKSSSHLPGVSTDVIKNCYYDEADVSVVVDRSVVPPTVQVGRTVVLPARPYKYQTCVEVPHSHNALCSFFCTRKVDYKCTILGNASPEASCYYLNRATILADRADRKRDKAQRH